MNGRRVRTGSPSKHDWLTHSTLGSFVYRYRYLCTFVAIGLVSVLIELALVRRLLPGGVSLGPELFTAYLAGMIFSFALNALLNFRVPLRRLGYAFASFAMISTLSFLLNMLVVVSLTELLNVQYDLLRLASAGSLFWVAYALHRRYTFSQAREFGLAVYASEDEDLDTVYERVGQHCDHVHVDLVDETMKPDAAAVRLDNLQRVRELWPGRPICLHLMSRRPAEWLQRTWNSADWFLVHADSEDDLWQIIAECRLRKKRIGFVWHRAVDVAMLIPYLPHLDFVTVLGIEQPGRSGQQILPQSVDVARFFSSMRSRYGYQIIFDGGVKVSNIETLPAKYIVAASEVRESRNPRRTVSSLRTEVRHEFA